MPCTAVIKSPNQVPAQDTSPGITKRSKSRTKPRSMSRSAHPFSRQKTPTQSLPPSESDQEIVDEDLKQAIDQLDDIDQRTSKILHDLQAELTQATNHMFDIAYSICSNSLDSTKSKVPQVQRLRTLNNSLKNQLRPHDLDHGS